MAYPTIINLPRETLNSILEYFCLHCCHGQTEGPDAYFRSSDQHQQQVHERSWYLSDYRQPLVSLCLVSRRLRDVSQPFLHHEFVLGYGDSWRSASSWDRRLTSFLRTIGRRPDLAAVVRRVSLHPKLLDAAELGDAAAVAELRRMGSCLGIEILDESRPPCYQGRPGPRMRRSPSPEVDGLDYQVCSLGRESRLIYVDSYTFTENFREKHALGLELLSILIGALPSVERLSIQQTVVDYDTPHLSGLRSVAMNNRARLLKTLDIATHDYSPELMIKVPSQAAGILELAKDTLQTLNLHMCNGFWSKPDNAPTFRSLKTLRLTHSHVNAVQLGVLLSCCTGGLTSFAYEANRPNMGFNDNEQFSPPEAIELLRMHARTLNSLHLDLRQISTRRSMQPVLPASLVDFTALEDLSLSVNTLWRVDSAPLTDETAGAQLLPQLLPESTTSLCVTGIYLDDRQQRLCAGLLGLARAVAEEGRLPRLRQVRCSSEFKQKLDEGLGPDIDSMFQGAGVEFGFGNWPVSQATVAFDDVPDELQHGMDWEFPDFDFEAFRREELEREAKRQAERGT